MSGTGRQTVMVQLEGLAEEEREDQETQEEKREEEVEW